MNYVAAVRRIAQRCQARGRPVRWIPGWETRGASSFDRISHVVNHFDAFPASSGHLGGLRTCTFGRPDLRNSLCMFYVGSDGTICVVAARVSWHAGRGILTRNSRAAGIEARNNNLGEPMPPALEESYRVLNEEMLAEFGLPAERAIEHREHAPDRKSDRRGVAAAAWRASLNRPDPVPEEDDDMAPPALVELAPEGQARGPHVYQWWGGQMSHVPSTAHLNSLLYIGVKWQGGTRDKSVLPSNVWEAYAILNGPLANVAGGGPAPPAEARELRVELAGRAIPS